MGQLGWRVSSGVWSAVLCGASPTSSQRARHLGLLSVLPEARPPLKAGYGWLSPLHRRWARAPGCRVGLFPRLLGRKPR